MAFPEYFGSPTMLAVDLGAREFFEDDESKVLDDRAFDRPIDAFTPKTAEWGEFSDHDPSSANPFFRPHSNSLPFVTTQFNSWTPGSCTPTPIYDGFPHDYDNPAAATYISGAVAACPSNFEGRAAHDAVSAFPPPMSADPTSTSPLEQWSSSSVAEQLESRAGPRRTRPGSPFGSHSPLMRRDGIRKKNARFDIPHERNLNTIDRLIAESRNEQEIKELKQQKRLLRNRQAALDSRQRKKQHTERLEKEQKHYTNIITELEDELAQLKIRDAEHLRREDEWKAAQEQYEQYIQGLHLEKEEMIRCHTLETGDLRKKNQFLVEHLQKVESTAMSAVPSSSGFSADFSDVDTLAMEGNTWDGYSYINDFSVDPEPKQNTSLVVARKADQPVRTEEDKPAASGLLLLLLLCGAFVASKSSTNSPPVIPSMPEHLRAASATVLDNIFKDAGVAHGDARLAPANRVRALEPAPSGAMWPSAKMSMDGGNMVGLTPSSLDMLESQLVQPTKEQEHEQLFSLSANQYNGVVSQDFLRDPELPSTSQSRRNLGARLAAMRNSNKGSAAEVYTRSLLWDKVPAEVVRDFARFVAATNSHEAQQKASAAG